MTNTLKFLRTFTLDEFKEWKGILQIRIIRNEQTGKYFFGYGDKAGAVTSKYRSYASRRISLVFRIGRTKIIEWFVLRPERLAERFYRFLEIARRNHQSSCYGRAFLQISLHGFRCSTKIPCQRTIGRSIERRVCITDHGIESIIIAYYYKAAIVSQYCIGI